MLVLVTFWEARVSRGQTRSIPRGGPSVHKIPLSTPIRFDL